MISRPMRHATVLVMAAAALLLTGCYESPDVTLTEPGVYKGKVDPLLAKFDDQQLQQELTARFEETQVDR